MAKHWQQSAADQANYLDGIQTDSVGLVIVEATQAIVWALLAIAEAVDDGV